MDNLDVREANVSAAGAISVLISELGYPTNVAEMSERLKPIPGDPNYATFVAEQDGKTLGVAGARDRQVLREERHLCPSGRSIGRFGYARSWGWKVSDWEIERWSAGKGADEVFVSSGTRRKEARRFYERRGYSCSGFRFVKALTERKGRRKDY